VEELTKLFESSDDFVKLSIKKFEDRSVTAKVIGEWKPILAGALREWAQQQRLTAVLEDQPPSVVPKNLGGKPKGAGEKTASLKGIIDAGRLKPPLKLTKHYKSKDLEADLLRDGTIRFQGESYESCSAAAEVAASTVTGKKQSKDGWQFWRYVDENGKLVPLDTARQGFPSHPATTGDQKSV
jgi:hypothetical protein